MRVLLSTTVLFASLVSTGQSFGRHGPPHQPGRPTRENGGCPQGSGGHHDDSGVQIEFCTGSTYAASEVCPANNPIAGSGTCGNFTVEANTCYTWSDFPNAPESLDGDVNYVYIPNGTEITSCGLYKTTNCTLGADLEWDSCDTGSTDLACRKHLSGDILSWNCTTG